MKYKIYHFDDDLSLKKRVANQLLQIDEGSRLIDIEKDVIFINSCEEMIKTIEELQIISDVHYIFFIDLYEKIEELPEKMVGTQIFESIAVKFINHKKGFLTGILVSAGLNQDDFDLSTLVKKFSFAIQRVPLKKPQDFYNELVKLIEPRRNTIQSSNLIKHIDKYDINLRYQIELIGIRNLNFILDEFNQSLESHENLFCSSSKIKSMVQGFSQAYVFSINNKYVLKISREKDKLKDEFERLNNLYKKLPSKLLTQFYSEYSNEEVFAFLIKEENGKTLFDWISSEEIDTVNIEDVLKGVFGESRLAKTYQGEVLKKEVKFEYLFNGFHQKDSCKNQKRGFRGNSRFFLFKKAIDELTPIVKRIDVDSIINLENLLTLVENRNSADLNPNKSTITTKKLVLCHRDLHSKNLIINPENISDITLIDTGRLDYDFWCTDICRLIVDLFINGIDRETYAYFDISNISTNLEKAKCIINQTTIEIENQSKKNSNYIHAINWLTSLKNLEMIYGEFFNNWEYKLGLMIEFIKISYRGNTISDSKRAMALMAAHECMISAEKEVNNLDL